MIAEEFEELMPKYLNFIRGVVDSDDLPLNVSREQLQQLKMLKVMSKKLIRKALDMIKDLIVEDEEEDSDDPSEEEGEKSGSGTDNSAKSEDEADKPATLSSDDEEDLKERYMNFWKSFGKSIKLGVIEDSSNRMKLAKLLRFHSTAVSNDKLTSLDEYIGRMKED